MSFLKNLEENLPISSRDEVLEIAGQLASDYIDYFDIDTSDEQERLQDSIEECLAHLEEVISALDGYKQTSGTIDDFVHTVEVKDESLRKLFGQVDAIEQYAFETNRLLDQIDLVMSELEKHQNSKEGRIKQLLLMIPGVSNLPRLGILSAFGSLVDEAPAHDFVESGDADDQKLAPISEILEQLKLMDSTLTDVKKNFMQRLHGETSNSCTELHEPMASLSLSSPENEDGSWQELM